MIGLLLNVLGVVKRSQDGEVNGRPRRQPWMAAENEFNDRLTLPDIFWCTRYIQGRMKKEKGKRQKELPSCSQKSLFGQNNIFCINPRHSTL